jgi:hypothetical protein
MNSLSEPAQEGKPGSGVPVFKQGNVLGAAFLFGPLAPAYMLSKNFHALGRSSAARWTLWLGVLFSIALFGTLFALPEAQSDDLPSYLVPAVIAGITMGVFQLQKDKLESYIQTSWRATSRVAGRQPGSSEALS